MRAGDKLEPTAIVRDPSTALSPPPSTHSTVCHTTTGHSPAVEERLSNARARARVSPCCASIETSNQSLLTSSDVSSVIRSGRGRRALKSATLVNGVLSRDATSNAAAAGSRPAIVAASTSAGAVLTLTAVGASSAEIGRHTSELQSQSNLVCRLLLEKKKIIN